MERAHVALILGALAGCRPGGGGGGGGGGPAGAAGAPALAYAIPGANGSRITVEVLNASGKPSLARAGTRVLRQAGIDVVFFGNAGAAVGMLDSTRIVVRRPTPWVGERVRKALQTGRVVVELDSTRLLDASVLLGADFAPRLDLHP